MSTHWGARPLPRSTVVSEPIYGGDYFIPGDWVEEALCAQVSPEIWFDPDDRATAISICERCPVRAECLEYELAIEGDVHHVRRFGIYGGVTPRGRERIARERRNSNEE